VKHLSSASLLGTLLALYTNIRLGWEGLPVNKHSSLLQTNINYIFNKFSDVGTWCQCY
jgi:hypothetical protein